MIKSKFRTEFSNDFNDFVSNSGNGEAIPQYELDENNVVVPKLDCDGKQVFHNLKADIQKNKNANDYQRLLKSGVEPQDIKLGSAGVYQDTTIAGAGVDLLNAQARLEASGMSYDDLRKIFDTISAKYKQKQEPQKQEPQKQEQKKDEVKK